MKLFVIAAALASAVGLCECSTKMVIGYFPNWLYANYPVESIPFEKYTHINYAFALLNNPDHLPSFPDNSTVDSSLPNLVDLAHGNDTKVLLSIGGWTGSQLFSSMAADKDKRKKFIEWNLDFIEKYKTDGVDIDWEYPGKQAAGCNEFSEDDADNFLLLLKELRQELDKTYPNDHKEISMAVHVKPFIQSGTPMTNVTEFVPYFDHINLMSYDINGAWASETGPNAPFMTQQGKGAQFSFVDSINDWKKAGVPSSKMTAGLAFYGRAMQAETDMTKDPHQYHKAVVGAPKGDSDDEYWTDSYCSKDVPGLSGIWKWTNLRNEGILKNDMVSTGEGWKRYWDDVTKTPWLFNPSTKHYISYDDPNSIDIKVQHALCEGLAGVMVWDIHHDNGELVDVVNRIHDPVPEKCNSPDFYLTSHYRKQKIAEKTMEKDEEKDQDDDENNDEEEEEDDDDNDDDKDYLASSQYVSPVKATEKNGDPCSISGEEKCVQSGILKQWLTCNINKWVIRDCSPGLVCHDSEGILYCDFPPKAPTTISSISSATSTTISSLSSVIESIESSLVETSLAEASSVETSLSELSSIELSPIETSSSESSSIEPSPIETSSEAPSSSIESFDKSLSDETSPLDTSSGESLSAEASADEPSSSELPFIEVPVIESSSSESLINVANIEESSSDVIEQASENSAQVLKESDAASDEPVSAADDPVQASEEYVPDSAPEEIDQNSDESLEKPEENKPESDEIKLNLSEPLPDLEQLISDFEKNQPFNDNKVEDGLSTPEENEPIFKIETLEKPMSEEAVPLFGPVGPVSIAQPIDPDAQNQGNSGGEKEQPVDNDAKENSDIKPEGEEKKLE